MSRMKPFGNTHVWYACLSVTSRVFADERNKKEFLTYVFQAKKRENFRVFAFSLLDDGMHLLLNTEQESMEAVKNTVFAIFQRYELVYREHCGRSCAGKIGVSLECLAVRRTEELLDVCRCIHRWPVEEGYVKKIDDYWWSSYITYRDIYVWEFVDTRPILWALSDDAERSSQMFLRLHRQRKNRRSLSCKENETEERK